MSGRRSPAGGGRGGRTRLAVYLSLLWVLASGDHSTRRPARYWAELIGLEDPERRGARLVRDNLRDLEQRGLVQLEPPQKRGGSLHIHLLDESTSGQIYTAPTGAAGDGYFRVPEALWTSGRLLELSGPGLAMYLVVLSVYRPGQPDMRMRFAPTNFQRHFGLGESTRKTGLANLVANNILWATKESVDTTGLRAGRTYLRTTYQLDDQFLVPVRPIAALASPVTFGSMAP